MPKPGYPALYEIDAVGYDLFIEYGDDFPQFCQVDVPEDMLSDDPPLPPGETALMTLGITVGFLVAPCSHTPLASDPHWEEPRWYQDMLDNYASEPLWALTVRDRILSALRSGGLNTMRANDPWMWAWNDSDPDEWDMHRVAEEAKYQDRSIEG
ncbi:Uu.00g084030.m01.CDS01 [Anthostomella pinea]|uniref:Uu.00g084030.m01.CDS01 n=1 Tax=Anthostomella pinea TaxID=933095 RepID=A0AAI8YJP5_9PEZI|nr:Uu.00g084030.m01.CDS01 [Anthostomella pinea]